MVSLSATSVVSASSTMPSLMLKCSPDGFCLTNASSESISGTVLMACTKARVCAIDGSSGRLVVPSKSKTIA